jgi:carbamoyl-phosphate synthase large subunit
MFVKPRGGSASIGARVVKNADELRVATSSGSYIAQEIAPGNEYTVDLYVDRSGKCRCAVPRLRIETRAGEVSKGQTCRIPAVEQLATRVAESLPGAWGVINTQIFFDPATGIANVIEINPRFGGGYPLTHRAGAHMARWVIEETTGRQLTATTDQWEDGLTMLRYDDAVFVSRADVSDDQRGGAQ